MTAADEGVSFQNEAIRLEERAKDGFSEMISSDLPDTLEHNTLISEPGIPARINSPGFVHYFSDISSTLSSAISSPIFPSTEWLSAISARNSDFAESLQKNCHCSQSAAPTERSRNGSIDSVSGELPNAPLSTCENSDVDKPFTLEKSKALIETAIPAFGPNSPRKANSSKISPYFPVSPTKRIKRAQVSCIPFPPLDSPAFGLVQERLYYNHFLLLIAMIFLNKTRGAVAMPVFYNLIARYPDPAALAAAKHEDIVTVFQHLGLQNQRARKCIGIARTWLETPPAKGKRYKRLHYPNKTDGKDIAADENPIDDDDPRVAWEIGHLVGIGAYAIDSWRIFCRDELRGLPSGLPSMRELEDDEVKAVEMAKEWTRVVPTDKELRAYLKWRWLRVGFEWDPETGDRIIAREEVLAQAKGGGVVLEGEKGVKVEGLGAIEAAETSLEIE